MFQRFAGALALCLLALPAPAQELQTKVSPNTPSLGDAAPADDATIVCRPPQKQSDTS